MQAHEDYDLQTRRMEKVSKKSLLNCSTEPSENSLEDYLPSYPGSPRELSIIDILLKEKAEGEPDNEIFANEAVQLQRHTLLKEQDFLIAAEAGDAERLQQLIRSGVNVHQTDLFGRNALHLTVYSANEAAILVALNAGISTTVKDDIGMTPLSICLMRSPIASIAELLFKYGAKILPRGSPMDTGIFIQFVMMCTPTEEEKKIFRLLVKNGAVVDDPAAPGQRQALHFAAMSNNCELIRILAELGANPFALNHRHETPRDVAIIFKCKEAVECLTEIENEMYSTNASIETERSDKAITEEIHKKEDTTDNFKEHIKSADITENKEVSPIEASEHDTGDVNEFVNSDAIPKPTDNSYEAAYSNATASISEINDQDESRRDMRVDSFIEAERVNNSPGTSKENKKTGTVKIKQIFEDTNSYDTVSTNDSTDTMKPANRDETEKPHNGDASRREKHSKKKDRSSNRR